MRSTCWRYFAKYVGVFKPFLFPPRTLWENNPGTQPRSPNWWDKFLIQPAFGVVLHKTSIVFHHEALCCVSWVRALPHPVVNCWWSSEIEQLAGVSSWDLVARVNTGACSYMFQRQMSRSEMLQPTSFTAVGRRFETLSWRKNSRRAGSFRCRSFPVQSWCKYPAIIVSMLSQFSQLSLEISVIPISFWSFCLMPWSPKNFAVLLRFIHRLLAKALVRLFESSSSKFLDSVDSVLMPKWKKKWENPIPSGYLTVRHGIDGP